MDFEEKILLLSELFKFITKTYTEETGEDVQMTFVFEVGKGSPGVCLATSAGSSDKGVEMCREVVKRYDQTVKTSITKISLH